jgi:hypothetical protein
LGAVGWNRSRSCSSVRTNARVNRRRNAGSHKVAGTRMWSRRGAATGPTVSCSNPSK